MKKIALSFYFLGLLALQTQAQETNLTTPRIRLGIELGGGFLWGEPGKISRIRESRSYYSYYDDVYYGDSPEQANSELSQFGVKLEYVFNKRFTFAAGLRYTEDYVKVNADKAFTLFNRNYFLWKISEDGLNTNFVTLNNISQENYYIGIPLEIKFFPTEKDYFVRQYFIVGTALNVLLKSANGAEFREPDMEKYLPVVQKQIEKPSTFQGHLYAGIGLKIGNSKYPFGSLEFHFPLYTFAGHPAKTLLREPIGFGLRTTFHLPIFPKHQLTYTIND